MHFTIRNNHNAKINIKSKLPQDLTKKLVAVIFMYVSYKKSKDDSKYYKSDAE